MPLRRLFLGLILLTGCAPDGKKVVAVTGTATRNGQPVVNATLHFIPTTGRPSWGKTDDEGRFTLSYDTQREGAEVGTHKVHVEFRANNPNEEEQERLGKRKYPKDAKDILAKYDRKNSTLTVEVTSDGKPLELKLD